jgi:poly(hydroxyalkanoate) depolymerase family esterase
MKSTDKMSVAANGETHLQQADGIAGVIPEMLARLHIHWPHVNASQGDHRTDASAADSGQFIARSFSNPCGTRAYKLYIPSGYRGQELPLLVMLHGCTQNADDFAAGTNMNALAEDRQCFVAYPEQAQSANGSKCWNWFNEQDQQREQGEPSIIAGITRDIVETYHLDSRRIYIAGLSSGGAMAEIMGKTYPDLFAAIGVHSGLPYASAQNLQAAAAVMKDGMSVSATASYKSIPVIVFHGDQDTTVNPRNGDQIIAHAVSDAMADRERFADHAAPQMTVGQGKVVNGRVYTHTVYRDGNGNGIAEQWIVHGAGHSWSGGSDQGSFTDSRGPDAAKEMLRFFLSLPYSE